MRTRILLALCAALALVAPLAQAGEKHSFQKGYLAEMNAVSCGYEERGAKGVTGELLGTGSQHSKTEELLCQEYVLRTDSVIYRIRPRDEKHPVLLPVGQDIQYWVGKDRLHLRVPDGEDKFKEREYWVVSAVPRQDAETNR